MPSLADLVREHAPAYLRRFGDAMPGHHRRALQAITDCRTDALGAELAVCTDCRAAHLLFHSCRHRACPRCGFELSRRWTERQTEAVLPLPYFHLVFTLPDELRRLVRQHQRPLLDVLFHAAFDSLQALCADPKFLGARIGALGVLHTWTRTLEWHPHVHFLVPGGGLGPDGRTLLTVRRKGRADFLVPIRPLADVFRARFLEQARRALPGIAFPKIPWKKSWIVYAKRTPKGDPQHVIAYLARYVHRTALSEKSIVACDDRSVTFTYRDSTTGQRKAMTLTGSEFLRRFLQHVPLPRFHRVRAFGLLHGHHRLTRQRIQLLERAVPTTATVPAATFATTASDAAPTDTPTLAPRGSPCPSCRTGRLRCVARLTADQARTSPYHPAALARSRAPP